MDFGWSEQQVELRERLVAFAQTKLRDGAMERDRTGTFSPELWSACAEEGVFGLGMPEAFGGTNCDVLTAVIAADALGYGCADNGLTLAINAQMWTVQRPILDFGSDEQKAQYLPRLIKGELIGAHANTEPGAGSDGMALSMRAERRGDTYVLNGQKTLITLAPLADVFLVFAVTAPERGKWGISAFLVDRDSPGLQVSDTKMKMGMRSAPFGDLEFTDCVIPQSALLGTEGAGVGISHATHDWDRCCILSSHLGAMERQLEVAVAYAKERAQFGQTIDNFQAVSHRLANMKLRLDAGRLLLYRAAWLKQQGKSSMLEGALAKLFVSEAFVESSIDAIRTHGGRGYLSETQVERGLRDAMGGVLYAGTSDIQRNIVARFLGLGGRGKKRS